MRLRLIASAVTAPFLVFGLSLLPISVIAGGLRTFTHDVFPNPFTKKCNFELKMPEAGHVRVIVYDVLGRHIRLLSDREYAAGAFLVGWDGTDEGGSEVQPGIYIAVLWQNGRALSSAKVVKRSGEIN